MDYKILESNGVDIEVVDGGAFNNFTSGGKSGIVLDVLDECAISSQGNVVTVSSGLLLIKGIRVKLESSVDLALSGNAGVDTPYYIVAKVVLSEDRSVLFDLFLTTEQTRTQENLYKNNVGTYELEIGRFIHTTSGSIKNLRRTAQIIKQNDGGSSSGLTTEEKAKVDKLVIDGTGDKFLADDGEYKEVGSSLDVQINGTSIVENGVANIPIAVADSDKAGLIELRAPLWSGFYVSTDGALKIQSATQTEIDKKQQVYTPITPKYLDYAIKVGLTTNTETLTAEQKANACNWLGATKLYKHSIIVDETSLGVDTSISYHIYLYSNRSTKFTDYADLKNFLQSSSNICILSPASHKSQDTSSMITKIYAKGTDVYIQIENQAPITLPSSSSWRFSTYVYEI